MKLRLNNEIKRGETKKEREKEREREMLFFAKLVRMMKRSHIAISWCDSSTKSTRRRKQPEEEEKKKKKNMKSERRKTLNRDIATIQTLSQTHIHNTCLLVY
jgi:hypothetical protein